MKGSVVSLKLKKQNYALELNASFILSHQCILVENIKMSLLLPFVKSSLEFRAALKVEILYSAHGQLYLRLKSLS